MIPHGNYIHLTFFFVFWYTRYICSVHVNCAIRITRSCRFYFRGEHRHRLSDNVKDHVPQTRTGALSPVRGPGSERLTLVRGCCVGALRGQNRGWPRSVTGRGRGLRNARGDYETSLNHSDNIFQTKILSSFSPLQNVWRFPSNELNSTGIVPVHCTRVSLYS